jgi:uncharacterized coiled-coil protein SlyX
MTTGGDRDGLIARIRQIRRVTQVRERPSVDVDAPATERLRALETRVGHLEQMVEGFQDSVHRESRRHERLIAELQAQVEPGTMREALEGDARDRGL